MNIAEFAIQKKTITSVFTAVLLFAGIMAFQSLSRLEDPEFTIKDALVITSYPGATALEVEEEVSEVIERAAQQLGQLKRVESRSERGLSTVTVTIKDKFDAAALPQVWDELRRKINDTQSKLPPGSYPSVVVDDFGDVYGIYYAVTGDGYTAAEIEEVLKMLQRELLLVPDVKKIDFFGIRPEAVYIEMAREKLAQFGISKKEIYTALSDKNLVANSGRAKVADEYIPLQPSGQFTSEDEFGELVIAGQGTDRLVYLRNVATIKRGYVEPQDHMLRYNGKEAYGLAISTAKGGNVVTMGDGIKQRLADLTQSGEIPFGMEINPISMQSEAVTTAINGFVVSLLQAVAIVLVVLLIFMGIKSGLIIGFVLFVTICGTLLIMGMYQITLERISLGALIIALGMLVDNAIVVTEGMLIKIEAGIDRIKAAKEVAAQTMMPLLGATVIAVLAFASIGTSDDNTGEYCRSLFQVILISLMLSWVTALTTTPLLCYMFFKPKEDKTEAKSEKTDPYAGKMYKMYKNFLVLCLKRRLATVAVAVALLLASVFGFGFVEQSFFPDSTRPQFMIDMWLDAGTHIEKNAEKVAQIEDYLNQKEGVTGISSLIGKGGNRFLLTYSPERPDTGYSQLLVDVADYSLIDELVDEVQEDLDELLPDATIIINKFALGPGGAAKIQARFSGPDPAQLRILADESMGIMYELGGVRDVRTDWRNQVKVINPIVADTQARANGITNALIAGTVQEAFEGYHVGVYREEDKLIPVISRAPEYERDDISQLESLQIWSPAGDRMIPITQVVSDFENSFENPIIMRRDRQKTITVMADPIEGNASIQFSRIRPRVEAMELPPGYKMEWGGEYEDSKNAQAGLAATLPIFIGMMVLITIMLFNNLRQPLIIWLCVPLALIGITVGLLVTGQPFGFMALLGGLSLIGMLIKNAIVLIDQINLEESEGKGTYDAIIASGVSRMRPVMMAASTTVLGLVPLVFDAFFISLAVTIMFGLAFASALTLIVVPVLYAIIYKAKPATS
jgi:multidrug efflux pump subunit AcrB